MIRVDWFEVSPRAVRRGLSPPTIVTFVIARTGP